MHLKVIQQMSRVPRSVGIPPLSDSSFEQAFTSQAALATASGSGSSSNDNSLMLNPASPFNFGLGEDDGRINPLAGMGLTDEQYNMILQNLVSGESFVSGIGMDADNSPVIRHKRTLEDSNDGRDGKRSRFEVIE
jgi:osomolarity two-component system response regulator SKN7